MSIEFGHLVEIYRHTAFAADGREGTLTIPSQEIVQVLQLVEADDAAAAESGITILDDTPDLTVGGRVLIRVDRPRIGLGQFVVSVDELLDSPKARFQEPPHYFVLEGGLTRDMAPPAAKLAAYRLAVAVVNLFAQAASYLDETRAELIFIDGGKFSVPVRYPSSVLSRLSAEDVQSLLNQFADPTHSDQKLEILAQAILTHSRGLPQNERLGYLLANLSVIVTAVRDGYRLFASNFSYSKIRSDLEDAKIDLVTKIHKTVVDIQGQLLGIPVATVIVASQLKVATACGVDLWTDVAVLAGAWIFWVLLLIAIVNQWLTLGVISQEIDRQKDNLLKDYVEISGSFTDIFKSLGYRICWHRVGLVVVLAIATVGALFATFAFRHLVTADFRCCL